MAVRRITGLYRRRKLPRSQLKEIDVKLYYSSGACSLAPHIALREAGLKFETEKVDLAAKKTERGTDYWSINPKGYVPALQLDDGDVLTEVSAILQYIADQKPASGLLPAAGSKERYRAVEWIGFITTELHKGFSPLFKQTTPDVYKPIVIETLAKRLQFVESQLGSQYLTGAQFTVADAYLFVIVSWAKFVKVDLAPYAKLRALLERIAARPAVRAAMVAEGLIKEKAEA
jgi:glutathione S-transferase